MWKVLSLSLVGCDFRMGTGLAPLAALIAVPSLPSFQLIHSQSTGGILFSFFFVVVTLFKNLYVLQVFKLGLDLKHPQP